MQFSEGDLVWKVKLLIKSKDSKFGKWSPGNAYILETLKGEEEFGQAINGKIFKEILS